VNNIPPAFGDGKDRNRKNHKKPRPKHAENTGKQNIFKDPGGQAG
ncbi:unnamed protein product, partial [marine sediment metagenome]